MSLATRLRAAAPTANASNRGCRSCQWWAGLDDVTRTAINEWLDAGHSRAELYEMLASPDADGEAPLPVSPTGWRGHLKHHDERCRGDR